MNPNQLLASIHPSASGCVENLDPETAATLEAAGFIRLSGDSRYKLTGLGERRRAELDIGRGSFTGAPIGANRGSTLET